MAVLYSDFKNISRPNPKLAPLCFAAFFNDFMGSSDRKRRGKPRKNSNEDSPVNIRNFKTLFPFILSPEGMKPPFLKSLYRLLASLSLNAQWSVKSDLTSFEICHDGVRLTFGDVCELSDALFKELDVKFENLFSSISNNCDNVEFRLLETVEVTSLLFRCCMLLLIWLAAQQNVFLERGLVLLRILRKLSMLNSSNHTGRKSFVFEKPVLRGFVPGDHGSPRSTMEDFTASLEFLEPCNPVVFLKSTILEVYIGELLAHGRLRGCIKLINSVASTSEMLFNPRSSPNNTGVVVEAISSHFVQLFCDKQGLAEFLSQLFCIRAKELRYPLGAPALSITEAESLLLYPIMVSAPKYMQVHLISLVSEVIDFKILKPDRKLTNCFLSTFEKSVNLYMTHMYCLKNTSYSDLFGGFTPRSPKDTSQMQFEAYISSETKSMIDRVITKLDDSSNVALNGIFCKIKSDLVSSSMRFVKECQDFYAKPFKDDVLAIITWLIVKASESCDDKAVHPIDGKVLQHICLVSSLLKLMSISLQQVIRCLQVDDFSSQKNLKDFTSCKEHDFIMGTINCFRNLDATLPLQKVLSRVILSHSSRHVDSKMMFLHFSGLLSLSFASGVDCLVKGCLLAILALLDLFVFEDGGLDALKSMVDSCSETSSGVPVVRVKETLVGQNSHLVVALRFQKIRSLYSSNRGTEELTAGLEEETEEVSNGEMFFNCMRKEGETVADFNDLIDFVECKQLKDYSVWLKNRKKYRRRRCEKMAVVKWKRKRKSWKIIRELRC